MAEKTGEENGDGKPEIKVVDRRSFTTDGRRRDEGPAPPEPPGADPGPGAPRAPGAGKATEGPGFTVADSPEPETPEAIQDASFLNLCVSLYESGFIHLGRSPEGEDTEREPDLEAARGAVEMLEMLVRKTRGNLSGEEKRILERLLAELQMAYVMKVPGA